jgi:hypothetical protein
MRIQRCLAALQNKLCVGRHGRSQLFESFSIQAARVPAAGALPQYARWSERPAQSSCRPIAASLPESGIFGAEPR